MKRRDYVLFTLPKTVVHILYLTISVGGHKFIVSFSQGITSCILNWECTEEESIPKFIQTSDKIYFLELYN